jgi:excisionase family DNA binding protein
LTVSVPEAAKALGISRNAAYVAARRGELPAIRIGKRFVIPRPALEKLLGGPIIDSERPGEGAA